MGPRGGGSPTTTRACVPCCTGEAPQVCPAGTPPAPSVHLPEWGPPTRGRVVPRYPPVHREAPVLSVYPADPAGNVAGSLRPGRAGREPFGGVVVDCLAGYRPVRLDPPGRSRVPPRGDHLGRGPG